MEASENSTHGNKMLPKILLIRCIELKTGTMFIPGCGSGDVSGVSRRGVLNAEKRKLVSFNDTTLAAQNVDD